MEDSLVLEMRSYLDGLANGTGRSQLENLILSGLKIIHLEKGILRLQVQLQETVEIEGRSTGTEGNMKAVMVEIRREGNREVIAGGNLWMTPTALSLKDLPPPLHKTSL
ncbi:hypothetical protein EUTSA_v10012235mg [Eutrema salsugineum]|uniref:Uncharacterized protein n=1 Tax=Eutrema salsugineum TaxID=72664 RepID=V4KGC7_EUTSA|nr:hypothetical protein EUTSA_v10012235mg [Eutrema salsugineum]